MQNIANNELTGMAQHDIACGQRSEVGHGVVDVEVDSHHSDVEGGHSQDNDVEGGHPQDNDVSVSESEEEFMENDSVYSDDPNSSPSSFEGENDDEHGENGLYSLLARWAIENGITHIALGELLGVLICFHHDLPKDPRTLLSTTKVDDIEPIAGGLYYHFGIAVAIKSALALDAKLKNCDTIQL